MNAIHKCFIISVLLGISCSGSVYAERIKDIASIEGVRSNQLVGYGLVVGLDKSGDKTTFTGQSLRRRSLFRQNCLHSPSPVRRLTLLFLRWAMQKVCGAEPC
jgi:flagellar basal body P-ring protein FlgI